MSVFIKNFKIQFNRFGDKSLLNFLNVISLLVYAAANQPFFLFFLGGVFYYSLQTEPTWEHKALSGTDSIPCARCMFILWEAPEKGGVSTRGETLAKELNLESSDFVFDRQTDAFGSGRGHQWLSGNLNGENFSAHNH